MDRFSYLPDKIGVKIFQGESGSFIAELQDLDAHTEADSLEELDFMINDLIYTYFNVPVSIQGLVRYVPESPKVAFDPHKWFIFHQFVSSDLKPLLR